MKILVFSTNGVINDGITSWMIQTFKLMPREGLSIDTLAFPGTDVALIRQLADAGISTHIVPSRKTHPLGYMYALRKLVLVHGYEIIHINGNSGTVAIDLMSVLGSGAKARILHSRNTQGNYPMLDRLLRPISYILATDRLACGTEAGEWLFGKREFLVIPNGREFTKYAFDDHERLSTREALGFSPANVVVGHVGNFNEQKNHRFLIDSFAAAFQKNQELRLLLVGDGSLRGEIESQIHMMGLESVIHLAGRVQNVTRYINAFDLAVLPSLYEGFPNVVIEWQVNGLPVLISSAITSECAVTDLVSTIGADDEVAWTSAIINSSLIDRSASSHSAQALLKAAGYEATTSAQKLRNKYLEIAERESISIQNS